MTYGLSFDVYLSDYGTVRLNHDWLLATYGQEAYNKLVEGRMMETPDGPMRVPDWSDPTMQDIANKIDPWVKAKWDAGDDCLDLEYPPEGAA